MIDKVYINANIIKRILILFNMNSLKNFLIILIITIDLLHCEE